MIAYCLRLQMASQWDPHLDHYAQNEEHILDFAAHMILSNQQEEHVVLLEVIKEDQTMVASAMISLSNMLSPMKLVTANVTTK
jgi:hypothetical protein